MPKFMEYEELYEHYRSYECRLAFTKEEFVKDVTNKKVPYYCSNNHLTENLSKNTFDNKVKKDLNPCVICSRLETEQNRINQLTDILEKIGCYFISKNNRHITYKCHCGNQSSTNDSNITKKGFRGCKNCKTNPFNDPEVQEKIRQNNIKQYGVPNNFQREDIKEKSKKTIQEKYGVDNVMKDSKIYNKNVNSNYSKKYVELPSGKIVQFQGYEDRCIDSLLSEYSEDEIAFEYDLNIPYKDCNDIDRMYYPDLFIPKDNLVIEVKSDYIYKKQLKNNICKFKSVLEKGYRIKLYVYDKNYILLEKEITLDEINKNDFDVIKLYKKDNKYIKVHNLKIRRENTKILDKNIIINDISYKLFTYLQDDLEFKIYVCENGNILNTNKKDLTMSEDFRYTIFNDDRKKRRVKGNKIIALAYNLLTYDDIKNNVEIKHKNGNKEDNNIENLIIIKN